MINQGDMKNARYQAQLDKVREFVQIHHLGKDVKKKLFGYNELLFSVNHGFDLQHIAGMFPPSVQQEVFYEEHKARLLQVPMFRCADCDDMFLAAISRKLRMQVVIDGDFVFQAGEVCWISSPLPNPPRLPIASLLLCSPLHPSPLHSPSSPTCGPGFEPYCGDRLVTACTLSRRAASKSTAVRAACLSRSSRLGGRRAVTESRD